MCSSSSFRNMWDNEDGHQSESFIVCSQLGALTNTLISVNSLAGGEFKSCWRFLWRATGGERRAVNRSSSTESKKCLNLISAQQRGNSADNTRPQQLFSLSINLMLLLLSNQQPQTRRLFFFKTLRIEWGTGTGSDSLKIQSADVNTVDSFIRREVKAEPQTAQTSQRYKMEHVEERS